MMPRTLDGTFAAEFNAVLKRRGLCDEKVAQHFSVSPETIERWKKGESAPHHAIQEFVLADLEDL